MDILSGPGAFPFFNLEIAFTGIGVSLGAAPGASRRNLFIWNRDKASATALLVPGMCLTLIVKLYRAAMKNSLRTRDMSFGHLEEPDCHMLVIAMLSQWNNR